MYKLGNWYMFDNCTICPNYGGWVIIYDSLNVSDYNIYKRYKDAYNARKKRHDGTNTIEPIIIGTMTDDQFIHALCENTMEV